MTVIRVTGGGARRQYSCKSVPEGDMDNPPHEKPRSREEHPRSCSIFTNMDTANDALEHDAPYVNLKADPTTGLITIRWKNYAASGTYRATLNLAVEWIEHHKLRYFLTDQRRRGPILHEDQIWLVNDWAPRMAKAGLERAAVVQSQDYFNRAAVNRFVQTVLPTVSYPIGNFQTMEEALHWLMTGEEVLA